MEAQSTADKQDIKTLSLYKLLKVLAEEKRSHHPDYVLIKRLKREIERKSFPSTQY